MHKKERGLFAFLTMLVALAGTASGLQTRQQAATRTYYKALLEPIGNNVIHGVGQINTSDFQGYADALSNTPPAVFMVWTSIESDLSAFTADLKSQMSHLGNQFVIPQLGLEFTGLSQSVAAGTYDNALHDLFAGLQALGRPVYLRVGIEANANGLWSNYPPTDYIAAFQHITNMIRAYPLPEVATVWQFTPAGSEDFMQWYPGDDYVDWWGISLFSNNDFHAAGTVAFMAASQSHQKPVMIAESTPANIGVLNGQASWDAWFAGFFDFIHSNANVKAFCYINWNWANTAWPQYGNARIQDNPVVLADYQAELLNPLYINAGDRTTTLAALGLISAPVQSSASVSIQVYPNPWRSDRHAGLPITFNQLVGNDMTIKIFTVSGHLIKILTTTTSTATWDLSNNAGDRVASGIYLYLFTNGQGQTARGRLAILR